jgi:hypothetical protein
MKRHVFLFLLFIILPFFSNSQISYNYDFNLPKTIFGGSTPRDIIYADTKIYVYTYKKIIIFDDSKNYLGKIEFSSPPSLGRFATRLNPMKGYVPDANMMAFASNRHKLFFVTPDLKVMSVGTDVLDTTSQNVVSTPTNLINKNLHGITKLAYDNRTDRIYWNTLVQNSNFHSWNSVFGVYQKDLINNSYNNIYHEFQDGSDAIVGFWEIVQSYTFNTFNDVFYISRKKKIDIFQIQNNNTVTLQKRIPVTAGRIGKMISINDGSIKYLLAFPAKLPYNLYPSDTLDEYIYWVNATNYNLMDSIMAPSKMTVDAVYNTGRNHIITCFSRDTNYYQLDTSDMDMAFYVYDGTGEKFEFLQYLNTQSIDEVDTSYELSINRPLKLVEKVDGKTFLSKKNEIVEIAYSGTTYTANSKYYAKDSYFGKGVVAGDNTYVLNLVNGGFEFFHTALGHGSRRTAYPAFDITHNPINRKLYFFNRLSTENTGFYIYDLESEDIEAFVETPRAIGDLAYNPVQNHILVSEFSKNNNATEGVRVYEGGNGAFVQTLLFNNTDYLGRMFVAPNSKIYVSANMKTDSKPPKLLILDATDYTTTIRSVGLVENPTQCYNLRSHFCYNHYNEKVYASFAPYVHKKPPYQTAFNGSSQILGDVTTPSGSSNGRLLSIDSQNNLYVINTTVENIGELICSTPDTTGLNSNYQGSIFVNGTHLHILDCKTNILAYIGGVSQIVDMDYSPRTNCLYAYHHHHIRKPGLDTNLMKVYKIKEDGSKTTIWEKYGFGASISYNKYDDQIYFYYRSDDKMLGGSPAKVYALNPYADSNVQATAVVSLPTYSFMQEVVPQTNNPFFDPYGKAYFPNGTHSSVSVVNFISGNEAHHLTPGPNWISVPRVQNNSTTNYMEYDTIPDVFNRNRFAIPYDTLALEHNRTKPNEEIPYNVDWKPLTDWRFVPNEPDNQNAFSYRGYILELLPDGNNTLYMQGQIKDPATTFPVYKDKSNWAGYFLVQEQDVFDALGRFADSLNLIKHQDWTCLRGLPSGPEPNPESFWVCDKSVHNVKYADMLILKGGRSDFMFQWSINGQLPGNENGTQNPAYYSYEEQSNYTPVVIELDSADYPLEIAAFVDDTCIGATVVEQGDSIVAMRAYLQGSAGDSVAFEKYYGNKSTASRRINSYYVWDSEKQLNEKRAVQLGERKDRYFISFKKQKEKKEESDKLRFNIWPNPASDKLFYIFALKEAAYVNISLFDITGKLMAEPLQNAMQAGSTRGEILLKSFSGEKLKPGIYLVKIKAGEILETKKVIVK